VYAVILVVLDYVGHFALPYRIDSNSLAYFRLLVNL
jgi:hypothetical protein